MMLRQLVATLLGLTAASAYRDDSYYANGTSNPNVDNPMYWRESYNVLQDLDQFKVLYVKFHSCAWSEYVDDDGDGNDNDNGDMDETDTWYLGSVPAFAANVGFSLYGATIDSRREDPGCTRGTYINSFVTTGGFDSFMNALALTGESEFDYQDEEGDKDNEDGRPSSECVVVDEGDENYADEYSYFYYDDSNNVKLYPGSSSMSVVCQGQSFVQAMFNSSVCDGSTVTTLTDTLEELNEKMQKSECVRIYSASENDDEEGDRNDETPVGRILGGSRACTIYDTYCPNPYGKLEAYTRNLDRATGTSRWTAQEEREILATYFLGVSGFIMLLAAALIGLDECLQQRAIKEMREERDSMEEQEDFEELKRQAEQARIEERYEKEAEKARIKARYEEEAEQARVNARYEEEAEQTRVKARFEEEAEQAHVKARLEEEAEQARVKARLEEEAEQARVKARLEKEARIAKQMAELDDAASLASREIILDAKSYEADRERRLAREARRTDEARRKTEAAAAVTAKKMRMKQAKDSRKEQKAPKEPRKRWFTRSRLRGFGRRSPA